MVPACERALGAEQPGTLAARVNLARWTGETGDAADVQAQLQDLVRTGEHVLGAGHPDALVTRHHLARWTAAAGRPRTG